MKDDIMQLIHISAGDDNKVTTIEFNPMYVGDVLGRFAEFLRAAGFEYMRVYEEDQEWVFDKNHITDWYKPTTKTSSYADTYDSYEDYDDGEDECIYEDDEDTYNEIEEFPVGSIVQCVSGDHSDAKRVHMMTGVVVEIKDYSPFGQTHRVRFTPHAPEVVPINWWVAPECLRLIQGPADF